MTYRKTRLSYVIWFLYTGLCVMLLAFAGYSVYGAYVSAAPAKLGAFLIFPLLVCLYLALRQGALAIRRKCSLSLHSKLMLEAFCVSVAFVFGFLARLRMFRYAGALLSSGETMSGDFMEKAFVRAGESVAPIAHGVSHLYVLLLSTVFSFLGNSVGAAMFLQMTLQLLTMVLGYRLVKAAAGRFAACATLLLLAFSPVFLEKIAVIDPECLFLFLYLIGMSSAVFYLRAVLTDKPGWRNVFAAILPGAVIGILSFFELSMLTLLFLFAALFVGKREEAQTGSVKKNILRLFITLVSCAAGFFILLAGDAAVSGVTLERSLYVWAYPYLQAGTRALCLGEMYGNVLFCTLLFLPAAFLVFAFFRSGKEQDHTLWLFYCLLFTPFLFFEIWAVEISVLSLFFWSVAAALGIKNCVFDREAEPLQEKIEQINAAAAPITAALEPAAASLTTAAEPAEASASAEKPRFLENPLPLPKKHVKREMDYDYDIAPERMHFDLELAEGDDFPL